jgi:hypothetical protein
LFLHSTRPVFLGPRCIGPEKGSNSYIILLYSILSCIIIIIIIIIILAMMTAVIIEFSFIIVLA